MAKKKQPYKPQGLGLSEGKGYNPEVGFVTGNKAGKVYGSDVDVYANREADKRKKAEEDRKIKQNAIKKKSAAANAKTPFDAILGGVETGAGWLFGNTAKLANTATAGAKGAAGLVPITGDLIAGKTKEAEKKATKLRKDIDKDLKSGGILNKGTFFKDSKQVAGLSALELAKKSGGAGLGVAAEVVPAGKAYRAATTAKKGTSAKKLIKKGAVEGAAVGAVAGVGQELLDKEFNPMDVGLSTLLGTLTGGVGGGIGAAVSRKARKVIPEEPQADPEIDDIARFLDAEKAFGEAQALNTSSQPRLLGSGVDSLKTRLQEIDNELAFYQGKDGAAAPGMVPSKTTTMDNLGEETLGTGGKLRADGTRDMRAGANQRAGEFTDSSGKVLASKTPQELRGLMKERQRLTNEVEGLESLSHTNVVKSKEKLPVDDPRVASAVDNELQAVEKSVLPEKVNGKVNYLVDYFRTPTKVLRKIGLQQTAKDLEDNFQNMRVETAQQTEKVSKWMDSVNGDKQASKRIFRFLDGDQVSLSRTEQKIANEMKQEFETFADKLNIPKEGRLTNYITHIFDKDFKGDTIDPSLARILDDNPTSKVYNPFVKKRLGSKGYKEDAFEAYEAYMKRAVRASNMDGSLKALTDATKNVDQRTADYLLKLNDRVAMKPSKFDKILNDIVGTATRDKFGPNAGVRAAQAWRNTIYRATLGLNVSSAVRNLTQSTNTFAELGARDTVAGYTKLIRAMGQNSKTGFSKEKGELIQELYDQDIIGGAIHRQDDIISAMRKTTQTLDNGLWAMFDTAELLNRGSAYFGAKGKFLRQGMSEAEAQKAARGVVGKTQFRFNDIETPLVLRSQVAKTLTQFQSFNIKQGEYLLGMGKGAIKGDPKEMAKVVRWIGANVAMAEILGNTLGIEWYSSIPINPEFRGVESPTIKFGKGVAEVAQGKDKYGEEKPRGELLQDFVTDTAAPLLVPGGTQAKKTIEGVQANEAGVSTTDSGRVRFLMPEGNDVGSAVFGQYSNKNAQDFFDEGGKAKGESLNDKQSERVIDAPVDKREEQYDFALSSKGLNPGKQTASKKVTELAKNGQHAKAIRLAKEWNADVDLQFEDFRGKYGGISPELQELVDYYKIDANPVKIKTRGKRAK